MVDAVRRRFRVRAVGHTGTLDPFATGLLVLVLGSATRLARFVERGRKTYRAVAQLGLATTTDDATGEPLGRPWAGEWPARDQVELALRALEGRQDQRPPVFSAKRVGGGGRRSYEFARLGVEIALAPVPVDVAALDLEGYDPPLVRFRAVVGPGTYVRALGRDLGARLGTGAHLTGLRRETVGPFRVEDAAPLDALLGTEALLAPLELVPDCRRVRLEPEEVGAVRHGRRLGSGAPDGETVALVDDQGLVAIAEGREGRWQPIVVLRADG